MCFTEQDGHIAVRRMDMKIQANSNLHICGQMLGLYTVRLEPVRA